MYGLEQREEDKLSRSSNDSGKTNDMIVFWLLYVHVYAYFVCVCVCAVCMAVLWLVTSWLTLGIFICSCLNKR